MRKLLLPAIGMFLGLAAGTVLIVNLSHGQRGVSADVDACFGRGELLRSWTYTVSFDAVENATLWGADLAAGEQREARECRVSPGEVIILDGPTGQVLRTRQSLEDALQYYASHPGEKPSGQELIDEAKRARQDQFTAVDTEALGGLPVAGCDLAWRIQDFPAQRLSLCFPPAWTVDSSLAGTVLLNLEESTTAGLNVHSASSEASLECGSPATFSTGIGDVLACATRPAFRGQSHHLLLPNGIKVFVYVSDRANAQEKADTFGAQLIDSAMWKAYQMPCTPTLRSYEVLGRPLGPENASGVQEFQDGAMIRVETSGPDSVGVIVTGTSACSFGGLSNAYGGPCWSFPPPSGQYLEDNFVSGTGFFALLAVFGVTSSNVSWGERFDTDLNEAVSGVDFFDVLTQFGKECDY